MKRLVPLLLVSLFVISCGSKSSPTSSGGNGGGSDTISLASPELLATIAEQSSVVNAAQVEIDTTTQAVTNAAITLTGPSSLSLPLTFSSSMSGGGYYYAYYYSINSWSYSGNQNYTMTVSYGGNTYQSTITSVGNVAFTSTSLGITISWSGEGNENTAFAIGSSDYTYGPNISSPYYIANSGLAGYTSGSYDIEINCDETLTSAFSGGAYIGSSFTASDQQSTTH